ncbi:DUF2399 domain-containing protein [Kitasatospora sp. NPDC056731]|uniref:DUF2399 domain-containing protein n=1 Tax=Kitasatospora sp. NPDC056731 TaxID=3155422 RepID=UPI00342878CA
MSCQLCSGACMDADLTPLLRPELAWLWQALAATADRRGDEHLTTGPAVTVTVPADPAQRAAAAGLIRGRPLEPGQRRRITLEELTTALAARGPRITPGAVAAHACNRRLAEKARGHAEKNAASDRIRAQLDSSLTTLPGHVRELLGPATLFSRLRGLGWITRLAHTQDAAELLDQALQVASRLPLPGQRIDRRLLVPGNPHALDAGALPALVLALTGSPSSGARSSWARLGVDYDDLLGGLIVTGVHPTGWHIPAGATVTIPPRELAPITWEPPPATGEWVFVTENPSVLAAAANRHALAGATAEAPRVICTAGTPSQLECEAIALLADVGWRIAVRADFDPPGLAHVRALLAAAPDAIPWRMGAADYLAAAPDGTDGADLLRLQDTDSPWDPGLASAMVKRSVPVYEEDLLPQLLSDIAGGTPGDS